MSREQQYADGFIDFEGDAILVGESDEPECRVCHCTQDNPCPGGCIWAQVDLCSACAQTHEA